jgi:hypothetical protein
MTFKNYLSTVKIQDKITHTKEQQQNMGFVRPTEIAGKHLYLP